MTAGARRPVIVEAVRTPIGRRDGGLSSLHAAVLLRHAMVAVIERAGVDASVVDEIVCGCVTQAGEQGANVARNAWLSTGLDYDVAATTVDAKCGSGQQANHLAAGLIASGAAEVVVACGVESMSRVPLGSAVVNGPGYYRPEEQPWDEPPDGQFGAAERIARHRGIGRAELDELACASQEKAAAAWAEHRFDREITSVPVPSAGGGTTVVHRDECLRATSLDALARLEPLLPGGLHTAATSSPFSDGAAAVLWTSEERAAALGLRPRARLVHQLLTGSDPFLLLDGPVTATAKILARSGMTMADVDLFEVNEAFAAVVLSWARVHQPDMDRVNVNGGALALGHPVGATGARLLTTALHELERRDGELALVTMCCGGALGTASVLQRL